MGLLRHGPQSRKWIIVSLLLDVTVQEGSDWFKWQLSLGYVVANITSDQKCYQMYTTCETTRSLFLLLKSFLQWQDEN